jgi:hypothetical protein
MIKTDNTAFSPFRKNASGKSLVANYSAGYNEVTKYFRLPVGQSFDINFGGQIKTEFGTAHVLITAPLTEIKRKAEAVPAGKEVTNG